MEEKNELVLNDFNYEIETGRSKQQIFTSIKDQKTIFNLDNNCDNKLNDCKGEMIRVKDFLIKIIETPIDEENVEYKKITILIDDKGKSYVTASKMFANELIRYIKMFGINSVNEGLDIKIIERPVKNSSNKALGFELV
jgi:hypothetical protein